MMSRVPRRYLRHSKTLLISGNPKGPATAALRMSSREQKLIALGPDEIPRVFEDHALAAREDEHVAE